MVVPYSLVARCVCCVYAGIQCTNRRSEICETIASSDCSLVAQKYIGRFSLSAYYY